MAVVEYPIDRPESWMNPPGSMIRQDFDAFERGAMGELPVIRRLAAEIKRRLAGMPLYQNVKSGFWPHYGCF